MRESRTSGLTRGRGLPSLLYCNYPEGGLNPGAIRVAQSANKSPSMNRKPDDLPFVMWEEISGSFSGANSRPV